MNENRIHWSFGCLVTPVLILALLAPPASAETSSYWWDTTATGLWNSTANWWTVANGTTTGGPPAATDDAVFNGTGINGAATVQLDAPTSVLGMTFANTGSTLLASNGSTSCALTTGTDGITVNSGAGAVTLGDATNLMPIALRADQSWTNNSSYPLTVVNKISNGSYQLAVSGSGKTVFRGGIGNGSGGMTKSGSGLVTLLASGDTTALDTQLRFTGGVNVTGGTLQIVDANALFNNAAGTGPVKISTSAGAMLELDSTINYAPKSGGGYNSLSVATWALDTDGGLTINGNGILRFNGTGSGVFGLDDQFIMTPVAIAMTGGTFDIAGGTLVNGGVVGGGTQAYGGADWTNNKASMNIASGATFLMWNGHSPTIDVLTGSGTISSGANSSPQTLTVGINNGSGTFSGVFTDSQVGGNYYSLTKTGSGVQVLSGSNTYSGTTTVSQGTLKLDFSAPGAPIGNIIKGHNLTLSGGTLEIQGRPSAINSQQFNLSVNAGASALTVTSGSEGSVNVLLSSPLYQFGGTIDFTLPTSGTISAGPPGRTWPCGIVNGVNSSIAFATVNGGSAWATLAFSGGAIGALTSYSTTNSFTNDRVGTTLITSSTSSNGRYTGVITFDHPNTTLTVTGNRVDLVDSCGILVTPSAPGTVITGGSFHAGNGANTVVLIDYGSLTVAADIGQSTTGGSLIVSGPGTTVLSGSNTYTGTTYINGPGTTILSGTNTGTGTTYVTGGKFYINGSSATTRINVSGGATLGGSGSAQSATVYVANGGILDFGQNRMGSTFGFSALNFAGGGVINLSDAAGQYATTPAISVTSLTTTATPINLYVSDFPTGSGTMQILKYSGTIGGSGFGAFNLVSPVSGGRSSYSLVNATGYIGLNYSCDYPYWTGSGDTNWNTASANNWNTASNDKATLFQAGDTVVFDNRASRSTSVVTIESGNVSPGAVTFSNSGSMSYILQGSYGIAGTATLTVNGGGTVAITNSNGYTGGTAVSSGTLQVGSANALGSGSLSIGLATLELAYGFSSTQNIALTDPNATILVDPAVTYSNGGTISGAGVLNKTGVGTLVLSGSNNYRGGTEVEAGTLQVASASALPDGMSLAVGAGATLIFDASQATSPVASSTVTVPEPGTLALLIAGAALLAKYRKRR